MLFYVISGVVGKCFILCYFMSQNLSWRSVDVGRSFPYFNIVEFHVIYFSKLEN